MKEVIDLLRDKGYTVATMESCTGGGIANAITNIEGASDVIKFSAVTYANEFKERMGVSKDTIDTYSVYSEEVAKEMSYQITKWANSNYGVGITGKLNNEDVRNTRGNLNTAFISIYETMTDTYYTYKVDVKGDNRIASKDYLIAFVVERLKEILK